MPDLSKLQVNGAKLVLPHGRAGPKTFPSGAAMALPGRGVGGWGANVLICCRPPPWRLGRGQSAWRVYSGKDKVKHAKVESRHYGSTVGEELAVYTEAGSQALSSQFGQSPGSAGAGSRGPGAGGWERRLGGSANVPFASLPGLGQLRVVPWSLPGRFLPQSL